MKSIRSIASVGVALFALVGMGLLRANGGIPQVPPPTIAVQAPTHVHASGGIAVGNEFDQVYLDADASLKGPIKGVVSDLTLTFHAWGFADSVTFSGSQATVSALEYFNPGTRITVTVDAATHSAQAVETDEATGEVLDDTGPQPMVHGGAVTFQ